MVLASPLLVSVLMRIGYCTFSSYSKLGRHYKEWRQQSTSVTTSACTHTANTGPCWVTASCNDGFQIVMQKNYRWIEMGCFGASLLPSSWTPVVLVAIEEKWCKHDDATKTTNGLTIAKQTSNLSLFGEVEFVDSTISQKSYHRKVSDYCSSGWMLIEGSFW